VNIGAMRVEQNLYIIEYIMTMYSLLYQLNKNEDSEQRIDAIAIEDSMYALLPTMQVSARGAENPQFWIRSSVKERINTIVKACIFRAEVYLEEHIAVELAGSVLDEGIIRDWLEVNDFFNIPNRTDNKLKEIVGEVGKQFGRRVIGINRYVSMKINPDELSIQKKGIDLPSIRGTTMNYYERRADAVIKPLKIHETTDRRDNSNIFSLTFTVAYEGDDANAKRGYFSKVMTIVLADREANQLRQASALAHTYGDFSEYVSEDLKKLIRDMVIARLYADNIIGTANSYYEGYIVDVFVFYHEDKIYDYRRGMYLRDVPMQGLELRNLMLDSLNNSVPRSNVNDGCCVLDYLYDSLKRISSFVTRDNIANELSTICRFENGISTNNIVQWAKTYHPNVSVICLCEADGSIIAKQKVSPDYKSHAGRVSLAFVLSGSHLYPITDQRLTSKLNRNIKTEIFDQYKVMIREMPTYVDNANGEEDVNGGVIATNANMEELMVQCMKRSGYFTDQIQINDAEVVMFRSPLNNKIYTKCENWEEIVKCCQTCSNKYGNSFDFIPHGQQLPSIARCLFNITVGDMSSISSYYGFQMKDIYEEYHQSSIVISTSDIDVDKNNRKLVTWQLDKISCYRDAAYNNKCDFSIYSGLDSPIPFNGQLNNSSMYLLKPFTIKLGQSSSIEYPSCIWGGAQIAELTKLVGVSMQDIICELPSRKKLRSDFLRPYFDATNELFEKSTRKKLDNYLIGLLNHSTGRTEHGLITNDVNYALSLCKYLVSTGDSSSDFSIKRLQGPTETTSNILMIKMVRTWKLKTDCAPIWNVIIGNAIINLIKKIQELLMRGSTIIAIKTDAIILKGKPISNQTCDCINKRECCDSCMNIFEMNGWKWKNEEVLIPLQKVLLKHEPYMFVPLEWEKHNVSFLGRISLAHMSHSALITGEAGAGKTTLLLDIVENQSKLNQKIVVLTFMNSAIQNIRELLQRRNIGYSNKFKEWKKGDMNILCCTTESFFTSLSKKHLKKLNENGIINEDEEKKYILDSQEGLDLDGEEKQCESRIDWIVIDEVSMLPSKCIYELCRIWKQFNCKIICCGDFNQLPPVEDIAYYYPDVPLFVEMCGAKWYNLEYIASCGRYDQDLYDALQEFKLTKRLPSYFAINSIANSTFPIEHNIVFTNAQRDVILNVHPRGRLYVGNEVVCEIGGNESEKLKYKDKYGIFQSEFYTILDMNEEDLLLKTIKGETWVPANLFLSNVALTSHKYQGRTIHGNYNIYNESSFPISFNSMYTALSRGTKLEHVHCIYKNEEYKGVDYSSCRIVVPSKVNPLHQFKMNGVYHLDANLPPDTVSEGLWYDCEEFKIRMLLRYLNKAEFTCIEIPTVSDENESIIKVHTKYNESDNKWTITCYVNGMKIEKVCRNKESVEEVEREVQSLANENNFISKEVGTYVIPSRFHTYLWDGYDNEEKGIEEKKMDASSFQTVVPLSIPFGRWYYKLYPSQLLHGKLVMVHEPSKSPNGRRAYTSMPFTTLIKIKESMKQRHCSQYDYEILNENTRLFCDIDCDTKLTPSEERMMIRDLLNVLAQQIPNYSNEHIRLLQSNGHKTSFHVIYLDQIFARFTQQKTFWKKIKELFENNNDIYKKANKGKGVIDISIYGKNRTMRNIYSKKPGKDNELMPVDKDLIELNNINMLEYFVGTSFVDAYSPLAEKEVDVKMKSRKRGSKAVKQHNHKDAPDVIKNEVLKFQHLLPGLDINAMTFNGYTYFLPRVSIGKCLCCDRDHDRQNGFVYESNSKYIFVCYADTSVKHFLE